MPDVFERFFARFDREPSDYYELTHLDPHYRVYFEGGDRIDVTPDLERTKRVFETYEEGAGETIERYLEKSKRNYEVGMEHFVYEDRTRLRDYLDLDVARQARVDDRGRRLQARAHDDGRRRARSGVGTGRRDSSASSNATAKLTYLLAASRSRFWLYLAGPVLVRVAYGAASPSDPGRTSLQAATTASPRRITWAGCSRAGLASSASTARSPAPRCSSESGTASSHSTTW